MINEIIFMKGYGLYVWSAFSFTFISFVILYVVIKTNLEKERNKFITKFGLLNIEKVKVAKKQSANQEIIGSNKSSLI